MSGDAFHRIGHGGASALAPANTLESFDAAVSVGIDMVEFDVREFRGELVLAHTLFDARRPGVVRLHDALAHLAGRRFAWRPTVISLPPSRRSTPDTGIAGRGAVLNAAW